MTIKNILTILIISISIGLFLLISGKYNQNINNDISERDASPTTTEISSINNNEVVKGDYTYNSEWFYVSELSKLILIPNWDQKRTSDEIISQENCRYLSSGGFYSKDEKPIGLFSIGKTMYSNYSKNSLFNGIFSKNSEIKYSFSQFPLEENTLFSIQSGPIIISNFKYILSGNLSEERGRRNIILSNIDNKLIFLTIYNKNSIFDGPKLGDLYEIINVISKRNIWDIESAINLDGGTASCFKNDNIYLKELSLVGSYFCVKK